MPRRLVYSERYRADIGPHVFPMEKFALTRDLLLERPNVDIDLVVEGDAIALPVFLPKADRYIVRYSFGDDFDTFPVGEASGYSRAFRAKVGYELYEKGTFGSLAELQELRRQRRAQGRRVEREPLLFR